MAKNPLSGKGQFCKRWTKKKADQPEIIAPPPSDLPDVTDHPQNQERDLGLLPDEPVPEVERGRTRKRIKSRRRHRAKSRRIRYHDDDQITDATETDSATDQCNHGFYGCCAVDFLGIGGR